MFLLSVSFLSMLFPVNQTHCKAQFKFERSGYSVATQEFMIEVKRFETLQDGVKTSRSYVFFCLKFWRGPRNEGVKNVAKYSHGINSYFLQSI